MNCPECRAPLGGTTGVDAYKHAIHCMHVPNVGIERLLADYGALEDERSRRIVALLTAAKEGR